MSAPPPHDAGDTSLPEGGVSTARKPPSALSRIKRLVRPAMVALALVFIVFAAWDLAKRWDGRSITVRWELAALSVVPVLFAAFVQGQCWIWLIERMAARRVPFLPAMSAYLESQLARYTPGKVGLPLVRMAAAPRLGVSAKTIGASVLIEMLSWLSVGGATAFAILLVTSDATDGALAALGSWALPLLVAFAFGSMILMAVDRRFYPAKVLEALQCAGPGPLLPFRVPLLHVLYWSCWAAHGYLIACSIGASHAVALASAGLNVLAPLAGFLALAAPAGAGVREAVLSVGLAATLGAGPAVAAAVISRAASLVADFGSYLVVRPLERRK